MGAEEPLTDVPASTCVTQSLQQRKETPERAVTNLTTQDARKPKGADKGRVLTNRSIN
jgi:hypothetical protein